MINISQKSIFYGKVINNEDVLCPHPKIVKLIYTHSHFPSYIHPIG